MPKVCNDNWYMSKEHRIILDNCEKVKVITTIAKESLNIVVEGLNRIVNIFEHVKERNDERVEFCNKIQELLENGDIDAMIAFRESIKG